MGKRNSWGSLQATSGGEIRARCTGPDGKRYRAPGAFSSDDAARAWLDRTKQMIALGVWTPPATNAPAPEPVSIPRELCFRLLAVNVAGSRFSRVCPPPLLIGVVWSMDLVATLSSAPVR